MTGIPTNPGQGAGWDEKWCAHLQECDASVRIGHHVLFMAPQCVVLRGRVRVDPFTCVTSGLVADDAVHVSSHVFINGGPQQTAHLDAWAFVGAGSRLLNASDDFSGAYGPIGPAGHNRMDRGDIRFGPFAGVAVGVTVCPGVVLPEGCCIAAHGLVTSSDGLLPWGVFACVPGQRPRLLYQRDAATILHLARAWTPQHSS